MMLEKNKRIQKLFFLKQSSKGIRSKCTRDIAVVDSAVLGSFRDLDAFKNKLNVFVFLRLGESRFVESYVYSVNLERFSERFNKRRESSEISENGFIAMLKGSKTPKNAVYLYVADRDDEKGSGLETWYEQIKKYNPACWIKLVYCPQGSLSLNRKYGEERITITEPFFILDTKISQALWDRVCGRGTSFSDWHSSLSNAHLYPETGTTFLDAYDTFMTALNRRFGLNNYFRGEDRITYGDENESDYEDDDYDDDSSGGDESEDEDLTQASYKKDRNLNDKTVEFHEIFGNIAATGFRLPSLAEWQYAAVAGEPSLKYPGSNNWDDVSSEYMDNNSTYVPNKIEMKIKAPNAWGIYDMVNNIREFTDNSLLIALKSLGCENKEECLRRHTEAEINEAISEAFTKNLQDYSGAGGFLYSSDRKGPESMSVTSINWDTDFLYGRYGGPKTSFRFVISADNLFRLLGI